MPFSLSGTSPTYTMRYCRAQSWSVVLHCDGCGREEVKLPGEFEGWFSGALEATLADVAARAKCSACGSVHGGLYTRQARGLDTWREG